MYKQKVDRNLGAKFGAIKTTVQYLAYQYSTVPCIAVQYSTVPCIAVQYSTLHSSAVQCSAVQCSAVQYSTVPCIAAQYSTVLCIAVQYSTVSYSKEVHCSAVNFWRKGKMTVILSKVDLIDDTIKRDWETCGKTRSVYRHSTALYLSVDIFAALLMSILVCHLIANTMHTEHCHFLPLFLLFSPFISNSLLFPFPLPLSSIYHHHVLSYLIISCLILIWCDPL